MSSVSKSPGSGTNKSLGSPKADGRASAEDDGPDPLSIETLLQTTLFSGRKKAALALLKEGADPDARDSTGVTPLQWACQFGPESVAAACVNASKDFDAKDADGESALLLCCNFGFDGAALLLINRGADLNVQAAGSTPLIACCEQGNETLALELIRRGADVKATQREHLSTALHFAVFKNADRLVPRLLQAGADPNAQDKDGDTPLHEACRAGCELAARLLVEAGGNIKLPNKAGATPLALARQFCRKPRRGKLFDFSRALEEQAARLKVAAKRAAEAEAGTQPQPGKGGAGGSSGKRKRPQHEASISSSSSSASSSSSSSSAPHAHSSDRFATIVGLVIQNGYWEDAFSAGFCCRSTYEEENIWRATGPAAAEQIEGPDKGPQPVVHTDREELAAQRHPRSRTGLMAAARFGHLDRLRWLLGLKSRAASIDQQERSTPAMCVWRSLEDSYYEYRTHARGGNTALHHAAATGHRNAVEALLKAGASVNKRRADGATALRLAAKGGFSSIVELLLKAGAVPNNASLRTGATSLHIAAFKGNLTMVRHLLKHKADLRAKSLRQRFDGGFTPLHSAVGAGHRGIVNTLLQSVSSKKERRGVMNARSASGTTPLLLGIEQNKLPAAAHLLQMGGVDVHKANKRGVAPLHAAARPPSLCRRDVEERLRMLRRLLKAGADVDAWDASSQQTPLIAAIRTGFDDAALELLDAGANLFRLGSNAFEYACRCGRRRVVARLVKILDAAELRRQLGLCGTFQLYPLDAAALSGDQGLVQDLLDAGADVKLGDAVAAAVAAGHRALGLFLLSKGAPPTMKALARCLERGLDDLGLAIARAAGTVDATALRLARQRCRHGLARALLEFASASKLHTACEAADEATALALIASGADCSAIDVDGLAPLQRALLADKPSEAIVKALLEAAADVHSKGSKGEPPLWLACKKNLTTIGRHLLEAGADASGSLPLDPEQKRPLLPYSVHCRGHRLLACCAAHNNLELARLLIAKGADPIVGVNPWLQHSASKTPIEVAQQKGHHEMAALLKSAVKGKATQR